MKIVFILPENFVLRPFSKKELETVLGVSKHVCRAWLKDMEPQIGKTNKGLYNVEQVKAIIEKHGVAGTKMQMAA